MSDPQENQSPSKTDEREPNSIIVWKLKRSEKSYLVKQAQKEGMKLIAYLRREVGLPDEKTTEK